ncbi:MAG: hypothetical protein WC647_17540 [Desulfomonilaceae bacterium]|jgi:hypothetical protein
MKLWLIVTRLFVTLVVVGTIALSDISPYKTTIADGFSHISGACPPIQAARLDYVTQGIFVDKVETENNFIKLVSATDEEDRGDDEADYDNDDKKDDKGGSGWDRIWDSSQLG